MATLQNTQSYFCRSLPAAVLRSRWAVWFSSSIGSRHFGQWKMPSRIHMSPDFWLRWFHPAVTSSRCRGNPWGVSTLQHWWSSQWIWVCSWGWPPLRTSSSFSRWFYRQTHSLRTLQCLHPALLSAIPQYWVCRLFRDWSGTLTFCTGILKRHIFCGSPR